MSHGAYRVLCSFHCGRLRQLCWAKRASVDGQSSCAPVTRKPSVPGLTRCLISPSSRKSKYQESEIQYLSRLLPQRSAPAWEATQSVGQQLRVGKESKEKGEGDIYLGVLLKQKMLTSPQSFINCSFQVCQRGEGELGRLLSLWICHQGAWSGCPGWPGAQRSLEMEVSSGLG